MLKINTVMSADVVARRINIMFLFNEQKIINKLSVQVQHT